MINFRYHVVSLTAVFLSLAVGLVLGSTVLNGPMMDALNNQLATLGQTNQQLREQVSFLEEEAQREESFATQAAPMLLDGSLQDRRVAMVVLPDAEDYAANLTETLQLTGVDLTGTVQLSDQFVQPGHVNQLLDLAHNVLPPSVNADDLPANSNGVETSAALLGAVLLDAEVPERAVVPEDEPGADQLSEDGLAGPGLEQVEPAVPEADRRQVMSGYAAADYLEFDEHLTGPAEAVVVVAALPYADTDAVEKNKALFTTVEQFSRAGPVVVAGAGPSGDGNLVAEIRASVELTEQVSTIDNALTPQGLVAAGLQVAAHLAGDPGHYGDGSGADALLPTNSRSDE